MKLNLKIRWLILLLFFGCGPLLPMCSSCTPSCSCDPGKFDKPLPVEINVLLPKFDCAQAPSVAYCCLPSNPLTLEDESGCCDAFKEIENEWVANGKTPMELYQQGFSPEQKAKYYEGCCKSHPNKACCLAVKMKADVTVCADSCANFPEPFKTCCANNDWGPCGNQPPPPPPPPQGSLRPEVECGCVDPEDSLGKDGDSETCFPIKKNGQPAKGYCQLKDPAQSQNLSAAVVGITKQQLLQNVTTIEWTQSSGHEILKVDTTGGVTPLVPQGGPFNGITIVAKADQTLANQLPPDRAEFTIPFPKYDPNKPYEAYGVVLSVKDVNGVILNVSEPTYLHVKAEAAGGGGCKAGGCSLMCF